jgi:hypothetical protein
MRQAITSNEDQKIVGVEFQFLICGGLHLLREIQADRAKTRRVGT